MSETDAELAENITETADAAERTGGNVYLSVDRQRLLRLAAHRLDEAENLAAAARMADRRNEELREALKEIARERSDVTATAAADNFQAIARIALSNTESEE